jgi:UDP:flavonoid glycosyltransferase YjiC (YdhE family)
MARIVILPETLSSVLNGGFSIGRRLRAAGHDVTYMGPLDIGPKVERQGFMFHPLLQELYPVGELERMEAESMKSSVPPFKAMRDTQRKAFQAYVAGDLKRAAEAVRPDLFIGCSDLPAEMIAASQLNKPVLCYHTKPYCDEGLGDPPMLSDLVPSDSMGYRFRNWMAWRGAQLPKWVFLRGAMRWNFPKEFRAFAQAMGFDTTKLDFSVDHIWVRLRLPYLVLFPEPLEFPRTAPLPEVHYLESGADIDRKPDAEFNWSRLDASKPLIYCSMGVTGTWIHPQRLHQVFGGYLETLSRHPEWQGLLSVGEHADLSAFKIPSNVLALPRVPQIDVLRKAAVFVTQGGALSASEACALGVPTVVVPLFYDQGAIASRIDFRRVGVKVAPKKLEELGTAIEKVLSDGSFRDRAQDVARELEKLRVEQRTAKVVESYLV